MSAPGATSRRRPPSTGAVRTVAGGRSRSRGQAGLPEEHHHHHGPVVLGFLYATGALLAYFLGGLLLGVVLNLVGTYVHWIGGELRLAVALALILSVLLVRPSGLFGRTALRRV